MKNIQNIKLKVKDMHCATCAININFELEDLNGILFAKTSYAKGEDEVEFDAKKLIPKK